MMRDFANYLTNELIVLRMTRALRKLQSLDLAIYRIAAYRDAGIPTEQIRDFDARAWTVEELRRKTMRNRQPVKAAFEAASLVLLVAAILLVTPSARAAEVQPMTLPQEWSFWIGLGAIAFGVGGLVLCAIWPRKHIPDDQYPYGDTTNFR